MIQTLLSKHKFFLVLWEKAPQNVLTYEGRFMSQKVTPQNSIIYANIQTFKKGVQ